MAKTAIMFREVKRNKQSGYTLVELLVVLMIIALSTAVIAPRIMPSNPSKNAKIGAMQLVNLYKKGRTLALNTGVSQIVIIDTESKTAWLSDQGKITFADDIEIETTTAELESAIDQAGIRFFSDGVSTGGEIQISSAKTAYKVSVIWANSEVRLETIQ